MVDFLAKNENLVSTLIGKIIYLVVIILLSKIFKTVLKKIARETINKSKNISERKINTLNSIVGSVITYLINFIMIYAILTKIFGIPDAAIISVVSVFSVAIGLGAQNFVKDIVTGFLFVMEDQFGVGDYVALDGRVGIIEAVGLRTTSLRSDDGYLSIVPNSQIAVVTNMSKEFLRAIVDVTVDYSNDIDQVIEILNNEMKLQKEAISGLKTLPSVLGITKMGGGTVEIKITADVSIDKKKDTEMALRKAIKERFDKEGIK